MLRKQAWLAIVTLMISETVSAESISVDLPELEGFYGGFTGLSRETIYDTGTGFESLSSITLNLEGSAAGGGRVSIDLEGVTTQQVVGSQFSVAIPLLFDDNVLDGMGPIAVSIGAIQCCDMTAFVALASITFVPEPAKTTSLIVSLIVISWIRRLQTRRCSRSAPQDFV